MHLSMRKNRDKTIQMRGAIHHITLHSRSGRGHKVDRTWLFESLGRDTSPGLTAAAAGSPKPKLLVRLGNLLP